MRLKGARDEHVVPVAEEFWPIYQQYLRDERRDAPYPAAWIALRKGRGRPLSYATFETMIRQLRGRSGISHLTAHVYRHTFAQNLLASTGNIALVQAFLAPSSPETTAATYARVPFDHLVGAVRSLFRIISRPNWPSGVWRMPKLNPAGKNYYIVVEAVDAAGKPVPVVKKIMKKRT